MILTITLVASVAIPVLGLAHALRGRPAAEIAISHFAYFTILFLAAFPFRAWLLHEGLVEAQVQIKPSAIPVSFVVDFSFGFGFAVALVLCFGLGRLLKIYEAALWDSGESLALRALAFFIFIWMFNLVRGGTAMGNVLLIFACVSVLMLGMRTTWRAYSHLILATFGRRVAK